MNSGRKLFDYTRCVIALVSTFGTTVAYLPGCSSAGEEAVDSDSEDVAGDTSAVTAGDGSYTIQANKLTAIEKKLELSGKYTIAISADGTTFSWTADRTRGASLKFEDSAKLANGAKIAADIKAALDAKDNKLLGSAYEAIQKQGLVSYSKINGVSASDAVQLRRVLYNQRAKGLFAKSRPASVAGQSARSGPQDKILMKNFCMDKWSDSTESNFYLLGNGLLAVGATGTVCVPPVSFAAGAACVGAWGVFLTSISTAGRKEQDLSCCMGYKTQTRNHCTCAERYPDYKDVRTVRDNRWKTMACVTTSNDNPGGGDDPSDCSNGSGCGSGPCNYFCGN